MERIKKIYEKEIENFEKQKQSIRRLWNIGEDVGKFLYRFVEISKPKNILELGTSNGYSTFWLSVSAERYNGFVYSVEVDKSRYNLAVKNLEKFKNVHLINGLIEHTIKDLNQTFDMVFIDANKSDYFNYIQLLLTEKRLNNPCVILADNILSHKNSVKKFVDFIMNDKRFYSEIENIGSGILMAVYEPEKEE